MKKTLVLIGLVAVFALLLIPAGVALADNGPHGGYTGTNTPDGCAACHRAHTAQGPLLLKSATIYGLCTSCHGTAAPGAQTNVIDGVYAEGVSDPGGQGTGGGGLHGGGFVNTVMNTNFSPAAPGSHASTSSHKVDGATTGTIWGIGAINSGAGTANYALECTDCHNPHGNSGPGGEPTYRILRSTVLVPGAAAGAIVEDEASKWYTIGGATANEGIPNNYFQEAYGTTNGAPTNPDQSPPVTTTVTPWNTGSRLSVFCSTCHSRYLAPTGSYSASSGDSIFTYRHPAGLSAHGSVNCVTCHVSHGTSAAAGTNSAAAGLSGGAALLRLDNRGTCANCHAAEWVRGSVASMTPSTMTATDTTTVVTIAGSGLTNFNAANTELLGGFIKLTKSGVTKYGVITGWSNTSVTFTLPSGMTAGAWTILVIPNGTRDSNRRTPLWPAIPPAAPAGQGTLTLN